MSPAVILAAVLILGAGIYLFMGQSKPGKHGVRMIRAAQDAGLHGAGKIIEERLGAAEAKRFLQSFAEGAAEPAPPKEQS